MIELVVATRNRHKTHEIQNILGPDFTVRDLADTQLLEIRENGTSFEENAKCKALAASRQLPGLVIADDSGLEVNALGGAPGIYSARYAGANARDEEKTDKLLRELARVRATNDGGRRARFRCVVALARNGDLLGIFQGKIEGKISDTARGDSGFGYDPIFVPDGFKQTFGELPEEVKNTISHRAKAIGALAEKLKRLDFGR